MSKKIIAGIVPCAMLTAALCAYAQEGRGGRAGATNLADFPDNPQSVAHKDAAKKMAGDDPVLNRVWTFFCTVNDINKPGLDLEGMKVFENLYALTSSPFQQTTVWAITTPDGIIMIDSGEQGRQQKVLEGFQKLGLDPSKVKYILLGHGHGDHYANAAYFQEHYGTRVGTTAADWDMMFPADKPLKQNDERPHRDLVLKEGQPITLGGETVNIIEIPGHTPGSVAFIFNVKDGTAPHVAGMYGGTILGQARITTEGLNQYLRSIDHYLEAAKKMNVDVEIQNHALFDETPARFERLKTRKPGEPNPFLMPIAKYTNFWGIVSECIRAEIARRPDGGK